MLLKIVQAGDPALRTRARDLRKDELSSPDTQRIIELMRETMRDAPGVGLAAPQVGINLRIAVIEDKAEYLRDLGEEEIVLRERTPVPFHVIVNPTIELADALVEFPEGCLSVTGFTAVVGRARSVRVNCLNHAGEPQEIRANGWYARILQHEIDHLNGVLYVDRMYPQTFMTLENYKRTWKDVPVREIRRRLTEAS
ncbi:MAG TPA: peptide deformylase [Bryobacteraceae bacterium]|nr:peptide deformylase [Bryobacteraceae bacterium]